MCASALACMQTQLSIFIHPHDSMAMQLLEAYDETVCVPFTSWLHGEVSGCTGRGEVRRHLISCYLLLRPGCGVVCLTLVKSSGIIKPTVQQAQAHKRDDESGEWSGL